MSSRSLLLGPRGALGAAAMLVVAACGGGDRAADDVAAAGDAAPAPPPLVVAASSPMAAWLVTEIGGEDVRLSDAIPSDVDHHDFQPSAEQIVALGEADLIVLQGASYESWREGAALPESRVVDLSAGLSLIPVEGRTHSHGPEGEHSHSGVDAATWMDPSLVLEQAQRVLTALEEASPERGAAFLARGHALETALEQLAARVEELGGALRAADVAVAGESSRYAYLARALGVELLELPDQPDDHDLGHLRRAVGSRRLLVLQPSPPDEALRARLANAVWVEVHALAAAGGGTEGYAYAERMGANLDRLAAGLSP